MHSTFRFLFLLLCAAIVALATGCATTSSDTDNKAERPWNAPMDWENGLPPEMMQGR
jgi:hypothetical protein